MLGAFRSNRHLARVNAIGASLALAAATSSVLGFFDARRNWVVFSGLISGLTTLPVAYWYVRRMQRDGSVPVLRSIGAAASNAGLALVLVSLSRGRDIDLGLITFMLGAVAGVTVWGPALLLTRLILGVPLAYAHRRAQVGLAAAESAQRLVALVVVGLALAALSLTPSLWGLPRRAELDNALLFMQVSAGLALLLGAVVVGWTTWAEHHRSAMVARAAAGTLEGYRLHEGGQARVLIQVSTFGEGYREGTVEEPVCELDAEGRVTRVSVR